MSEIKSIQDTDSKFIEENMEFLEQVIQISFPLIPCDWRQTNCSSINIYKIPSKNEFYVGIELTQSDITKYYIFPLYSLQWTLDDVLEYIYQTPEYSGFIKQGYEFKFELTFEATNEYTTDNFLALPLDKIPLSQGTIHYRNTNKKTLDSHKWFAHQFSTRTDDKVHMCFSRYGVFYINTHYIFSGTKAELQIAFDKLQQEVDEDKAEPYFGRGDHDELLDTPLEAIKDCECHDLDANEQTYDSSHWVLQSFDTQEELDIYIEKICKKKYRNGYSDEFIGI